MIKVRKDIKEIAINKLVEYEKNNKIHTKEQLSLLIQIIDKFGFTQPLLIDKDNNIIAGHGRKKAAERLGMKKLPCLVIDDLSESEIKALRIADNRVAELAETSMLNIKEEYFDLLEENSGLEFLTGYNEEDFLDLLEDNQEVEEDDYEVPEDVEEVKTDIKRGDVIKLGNHTLMCGSSTDIADVENLLDGNKVELCFTDPPYGNGNSGKYGRGQLGIRTIKNDEDFKCVDSFFNLNVCDVYVFFLQWRTFKEAIQTLENNNLKLRTVAVWDKKNAGLNGAGGLAEQWEAIIFAGEFKFSRFGGNVFSVSREQKNRSESPHPHQKPILLLGDLFEYLQDYKTMFDPFGGSGSTLIACEQLNRQCYIMELDEKYCEVICQRWEKLTGKQREVL